MRPRWSWTFAATGFEAVSASWGVNPSTGDMKADLVWAEFFVSEYFGQGFIGQEPLEIDMSGTPPPIAEGTASPQQPYVRLAAKGPQR